MIYPDLCLYAENMLYMHLKIVGDVVSLTWQEAVSLLQAKDAEGPFL